MQAWALQVYEQTSLMHCSHGHSNSSSPGERLQTRVLDMTRWLKHTQPTLASGTPGKRCQPRPLPEGNQLSHMG